MTVFVDGDLERARERNRLAVQRYRDQNRERVRENARKRARADPERARIRHLKWYRKVKDKPAFKEKALADARRTYAPRKLKKIIALTGGPKPSSCDVCRGTLRICLDHCHETGSFRGWLCDHCNLILGHAKDDPALLRNLADYLEKARS